MAKGIRSEVLSDLFGGRTLIRTVKRYLERNDALLKHGLIMFAASAGGSVLNYLYQLLMGRMLGPEQYGVLGALLSLTYVLTVPAQTIRTSTAKLVSRLRATGREGDLGRAIRQVGGKVSWLSFAGLIAILAGSVGIARFLRIPSAVPVMVLGLAFFFQLIVPALNGGLLGLQRFVRLGVNQLVNFGSKLILGVALVALGLGVKGALAGLVLGAAFSVGLGLYFLRDVLSRSPVDRDLPKIGSYSAYTLLAFLFLTLLYNLDILLVKRLFTDLEAGYYVAAATIAKMVFFGSIAIAGAMFPKVAVWAENGDRDTASRLVKDALLYTGLLAGFGSLIVNLFPRHIVSLLYGAAYEKAGRLVGPFSVGMVFLSLSYVLATYQLALGHRRFVILLALAVALEAVGILFLHATLTQVVLVVAGTMAVLFACMALSVVRQGWGREAEAA